MLDVNSLVIGFFCGVITWSLLAVYVLRHDYKKEQEAIDRWMKENTPDV